MSTVNDKSIFEEPKTICDLDSDELDFLIRYRKLTPEEKENLSEYIGTITE